MSYAICEQQRRRSACASVQSDQPLCCSLPRQNDTSSLYNRNFEILAGLCSCQFVSCLVGDSRRQIFTWRGSTAISLLLKEITAPAFPRHCRHDQNVFEWHYPNILCPTSGVGGCSYTWLVHWMKLKMLCNAHQENANFCSSFDIFFIYENFTTKSTLLRSCLARSINTLTLFLGRQRPLVHIHLPVTDNCPLWIGKR